MAKTKEIKTNAMRILESMKIPYAHLTYECDEFTDGLQIADMLSLPYEKVYKTLVTSGSRGEKQPRDYYVFVIPVAQELDLKAAARSVGVKSVEMIHVKDINKITGYIRGSSSWEPMRPPLTMIFSIAWAELSMRVTYCFFMPTAVQLDPQDLARATGAEFADIIRH